MMKKLLVILLSAIILAIEALPTTYDQRQDGDLNVKVDLDNFVILVARPSSVDLLGSMADLFGAKNVVLHPEQISAQIDESGKEQAKKADDEVKLDKTRELDDVSLEPKPKVADTEKPKEDDEETAKTLVVVTKKEAVAAAAAAAEKPRGQSLMDVIRKIRNIKEHKEEKEKAKSLSDKYKFVMSVEEPQSLKLVGDAIENCGPGRSRDSKGICQRDRSIQQ